ncbi:MAG TPA: TlyA family RNA methyltransferase [Actinomycetota bacterium]|nr:TlyA family RNA methyltransferase [Actinomycetota bacterium]
MTRRRLDAELVRRGLVPSRTAAREAVDAGLVTIAGRPATKAATLVAAHEPVQVTRDVRPFASRGGAKLDAALERFGIDVAGADCLDAGASTGGFTDVLLKAGARHVVAIDVGYGQLAWDIRNDHRVTVYERTNVRDVTPSMLPYAPTVVVADLSFISLAIVVPTLVTLATPDATFVVLVKPQFEAGRDAVGRDGVVRDASVWRTAIVRVATAFRASGAGATDVIASPLRGPAGNVEFLVHARGGRAASLSDERIDAAVEDGRGSAA